jgi:hypothetical protein
MAKPEATESKGIRLSETEKAVQRRRNVAIGIGVAAIVLLFYVITIFKMGPAIMNRSL